MKKKWLILFLVIFLIPFSFANTLNVPINYTTIQDAINNASNGDVINVSAGVYEEDLVIPVGKNNLEIKSDESATIKGVSNIDISSWPTVAPNIEILSDGEKLHGFTIESPDYVALKYTSGIVIGGENVEIYENNFVINSAGTTDEISQVIQTYSSGAMPDVDISGLNIHNNNFNHKGSENWGYEAIYINPDAETNKIYIKNNKFNGKIIRAISSERSKTTIENNEIITDMVILPDGWVYEGAWQGINIGKTGSQTQITIKNNTITGSDDTKGFKEGIRLGKIGQLFSTTILENNSLSYNEKAILVMVANGVKINFNEIFNNTLFGVNNTDSNGVNAENNWWGSCDGPSGFGSGNGDAVSSNVTFSNWLGACVENAVIENSCVLETDNVTLYANVSSQFCIGDVTFSVYSNGNWTNYAGVENSGAGNYSTLINSNFSNGGEWINWTVYVEDCYGHTIQNGIQSFYVNSPTSLSIEPSSPDGLNGWYISEPEITLTNLDATNIWYRWDSTGTKNYVLPFKLEDSPNNGNITGGIMELNYWSDICGNESENSQILKVDFKNPSIINLIPFGEVVNNLMPLISAYLDEVYQSNSGINTATIQVLLDGIIVPINISLVGDLDANVNYLPVTNLSEGLHNVTINVTDNAGRTNNVFWEFNISISPIFDFQINSPMDEIYEDKKIVFNISASEELDLIEYKELNDGNSKWKKICSDCEEYGYSHKRTKIFSDGEHNLSIRATDYYSQVKEENISIFIDSTAPKISKNLPKKNAVINGSDFYVKFKEENPINLTLYFNGTYDVDLENECDFDGRYYECDFDVNLTNHDGEEIEYWFNLTDVAGNFDESKLTNVKVDTTSPILNNESYWVRGTGLYWNYVYFTFNVTEENFDEISYSYLDSKGNLKERKLCSKLKNGICETRKKIYDGQEIGIKILDDAGNSWIDEFVA